MRTTGIQVSGFGFLLRRLELALVIGDARMAHDPLRNQRRALAVGLLMSLLIAGGAVMLGLLKPKPTLDGDLVADEFGGLHVRLGETYHPITNVASARLVLGAPVDATKSTADQLAAAPHGAPMGVGHVPGLDQAEKSSWFLCSGQGELVSVHAIPESDAHMHTRRVAVATDGQELWLLNGQSRTLVDPSAARALGVDTVAVNQGFLKQYDLKDPSLLPQGPTGLPAPFDEAGVLLNAGGRVFMTAPGGVAELKGAQRAYAEGLSAAPPRAVALADVVAQPGADVWPFVPREDVRASDWASAPHDSSSLPCAGQQGTAVLPAPEGTATDSGFVGPRGTSPVVTERGLFLIDDAGLRYSVGTSEELSALGFKDPVGVPWRTIAGLTDAGLLSGTTARQTVTAMNTSESSTAKDTGTM
ncbi:type VII secretion protein EccB [Corynebacterium sp. 320]|uniref:type VII secretion protein EccB n=1 Tax=Corynebacterium TaxID=1716 RepID=UPI00125CAF06|nr:MULTISPECIES: type VII secretion protein EccB [Corynebacterium]KAB1504265.1 type VII secretion protein EccB [Corynebacterium sp. 320]KAB1552635.1 type VII secretion protein EccB [Corynebacterium sp. 321]KAB1554147.1 type VII secretion protein EccB [Corynebacterium sp. 319]KAB3528401.1 type VII secretion protein EccB [Corynebacterium sp. 250]KAB3540109.1 type VII secretion protein EccB [Corynebacterium sp. 366]